jgi:hypothetical protein
MTFRLYKCSVYYIVLGLYINLTMVSLNAFDVHEDLEWP